jgi:hypothetical protein
MGGIIDTITPPTLILGDRNVARPALSRVGGVKGYNTK